MVEAANKNKPHKLIIDNRNSMSMTGVTKVISIDTDLVLLEIGRASCRERV